MTKTYTEEELSAKITAAEVAARLDEVARVAPPQLAKYFDISWDEINQSWLLEYCRHRRTELSKQREG